MHEATVAQSILDIVLEETKKAQARKVLQIHIAVGELSCISPEAVSAYFQIISEGTPAEGASMIMNLDKAVFRCKKCGAEYTKDGDKFACPACMGEGILIKQHARDFYIEKMEVE